MKDKVVSILSTRPLDEQLVSKALESDCTIDCLSFIQTQSIADINTSRQILELAAKPVTAVFTSMNGAEVVIDLLQKNRLQPFWNIYCIGAATETLIKKYFTSANITGSGSNALEVAGIIVSKNVKEVIFFCGNQRRDELPAYLQKNKVRVDEIVVYATIETPVKIEKDYNGILFFSPSAVKSFFSVNSISANTVLFSIGDTTADAIRKFSGNKIIISDFPTKDKLVDLAINFFNEK